MATTLFFNVCNIVYAKDKAKTFVHKKSTMISKDHHKLLNIFISTPSLVVSMNINELSGLCIMAVMGVFVLTVTVIYVTPAAIAQNMTGGNTTGGNTTGKIGSSLSREEVEALCSLSPACIT
jgi:uncharacterized membrane protein